MYCHRLGQRFLVQQSPLSSQASPLAKSRRMIECSRITIVQRPFDISVLCFKLSSLLQLRLNIASKPFVKETHVYVTRQSVDLCIDVYRTTQPKAPSPILLWFHGGYLVC